MFAANWQMNACHRMLMDRSFATGARVSDYLSYDDVSGVQSGQRVSHVLDGIFSTTMGNFNTVCVWSECGMNGIAWWATEYNALVRYSVVSNCLLRLEHEQVVFS